MRNFIEYFAGIGLIRLGLEKEGWTPVYANDIDFKKQLMYDQAFPDQKDTYVLGDIHTILSESVPFATLATASFPCVDLSIAGKQQGLDGNQSGAYWGLIRILTEQGDRKPPLILLENVPGWLTARGGKDFREGILALNNLGYRCDAFILDARYFVPQSRPRLFVVGARGIDDLNTLPVLIHTRAESLRSTRLLSTIRENADLDWMFIDLPEPPTLQVDFSSLVEELADDAPEWWKKDKVEKLHSQMSEYHKHFVDKQLTLDTVSYLTAYRRVRSGISRVEVRRDNMAGCLRTPTGGSSKQIVISVGRGELKARWMTAREYARLQGVPDSYPIEVPYTQALYGFGDAVCVPAISWIGKYVLNPLAIRLGV